MYSVSDSLSEAVNDPEIFTHPFISEYFVYSEFCVLICRFLNSVTVFGTV